MGDSLMTSLQSTTFAASLRALSQRSQLFVQSSRKHLQDEAALQDNFIDFRVVPGLATS